MKRPPFKYQIYAQTGLLTCRHHGTHHLWNKTIEGSNALTCGKCKADRKKRWIQKNYEHHCTQARNRQKKRIRKDPVIWMLYHAKYRAKKAGREFNLTKDFILKLFHSQHELCALSGQKFFDLSDISIDRIDSSKGYTEANIQLVALPVNQMKMDLSQAEFIENCKAVAAWNSRT